MLQFIIRLSVCLCARLSACLRMTVTYSSKVANASFFTFHRLLLRWRGSIYKLLYREFMVFVGLYSALSVVYRSLTNPALSVSECQRFLSLSVVLSFIFLISLVLIRY